MQKKSIKGNLINFDENSLNLDLDKLLLDRFPADLKLDGTIDDLLDPYLLCDMDKAVERIKLAKEQDEKIMIFGDYDVDGVTSTSILMHFFQTIGLKASYRLPHRVNDGYGLKDYFIDELNDLGVSLVITVDCGTRDVGVIKHAKSLGIDVIVTDHHAVPEIIPEEAVAIINPKRTDCGYPFKGLAGAGVAFKLMSALAYEFMGEDKAREYIIESIDIAAIGTVADCMSLTGENRIIVTEGLKQIKNTRSRGIRTLLEDQVGVDLDAEIFGFTIGPRLNAAGRMDSPYKAVNLILNNSDSVDKTLYEIEQLNEKRKFLTRQFIEEAMQKVNKKDNMLFYISPAIEHGIIGIVAGRLTESFYKPSIVLKDEGDKLVASCRSPDYFSMVEILEKYKDYFIAFGGHKQAAGFSISRDKFGEFKSKILKDVNSQDFSKNKKELNITKLVKIEELGFGFLNRVNKYKPFGIGNEKPVFMVEDLDYDSVAILGNNSRDHIRFNTKYGYKIFGFGFGEYLEKIKKSQRVDLIFDLSEDNWMGKKNLMLKVVDLIIE